MIDPRVAQDLADLAVERDDLRAKLAHTDKDYEALKGDLDAALARAADWQAKAMASEANRLTMLEAKKERDAAQARVKELEAKDCGCAFKSFNHKAHCLKQSRIAALEVALGGLLPLAERILRIEDVSYTKELRAAVAHAHQVLEEKP